MLSVLEREFLEFSSHNSWEMAFRKLQNESYPFESCGSFNVARNPEFINLNRYRNVLPYDDNLIKLHDFDPIYINASLISTEELPKQKYIFTQGPLKNTAGHFWLMVWQNKCPGIIMLNRIYENGTLKCFQYFPEKIGAKKNFPGVNLQVECIQNQQFSNYVHRIIKLTNLSKNEEQILDHFNFTEWPDFGAPKCPQEYLEFLKSVRSTGTIDIENRPSIVHCSAGIGRSGTFALIDIALKIIQLNRSFDNISILKIIKDLRKCRAGVIQSPDQLKFCYIAIMSGGKAILEEDDTKPASTMSSQGPLSQEPADDLNTNNVNSTGQPQASTSVQSLVSGGLNKPGAGGPAITTLPTNRPGSHDPPKPKVKVPEKETSGNNSSTSEGNIDEYERISSEDLSSTSNESLLYSDDDPHIEPKNDTVKTPEKEPENKNVCDNKPNENVIGDYASNDEEKETDDKKPEPTSQENEPDSIDCTLSREDFASETDFHLERLKQRMAKHKMKLRGRLLPQSIRSKLQGFLVHSNYIKSTKQAIKLFSIIAVVFISIAGFYVNKYLTAE